MTQDHSWLLGHTIVAVGVLNDGGMLFPVIKLDSGAQVCIQSDDEGNSGGVLLSDTNKWFSDRSLPRPGYNQILWETI